jgi:hypothetical protein
VRHVSRFSGLLYVETSQTLISQFGLKDWRRHDDEWYTWYHRGGCVEDKLKTNGSMRQLVSNPATLTLLFLLY